jgi:hypothetical protein
VIARFLSLLFVAITLGACTGDTGQRSRAVVRDSAGIRIVENTAPLWQEGEEWYLGAEPSVDIGGGGTDEDLLFRVEGALRLSDGRIVISNGGSNEIRFYDDRGGFVKSTGRQGEGPGEFTRLGPIDRIRGDSLAVTGWGLNRQSVFDSNGDLARTVGYQPTTDIARPVLLGTFDDGSALIHGGSDYDGPLSGLVRAQANLFRFDSEGSPANQMGVFPESEAFYRQGQNFISLVNLPFARRSVRLVVGDHFYFAHTARYEVQTYGTDGVLQMLVRKHHELSSVTAGDKESLLQQRLEGRDVDARRTIEREFRDLPIPETKPAFGGEMRVDATRHLWVLELNDTGADPSWSVFDTDGVWLGVVTLPSRFTPMDIGTDYVLGLWRDADGVEHVRMYELIKPNR